MQPTKANVSSTVRPKLWPCSTAVCIQSVHNLYTVWYCEILICSLCTIISHSNSPNSLGAESLVVCTYTVQCTVQCTLYTVRCTVVKYLTLFFLELSLPHCNPVHHTVHNPVHHTVIRCITLQSSASHCNPVHHTVIRCITL